MQYRLDKKGTPLSVLGYGCMRFTRRGGGIDLDKAEREIMAAIAGGVNYFDTAYIYPGSEAALGRILEKNHCRERVYIATKLPHYLMRSVEAAEKCFQEQLRRLRTGYIDYYLMHMLTDDVTWKALCQMGIDRWLREKLDAGQIRHVGFSYHGNSDTFCRLVDAWNWDFCQIQYNYLDEHSQAGRTGLQYAAEKGLPVIIMEPLRGGRLVNGLPQGARELFMPREKSCLVGFSVAVGPAGGDCSALGHELHGDAGRKSPRCVRGGTGEADRGRPCAACTGKTADTAAYEGALYRLPLLYALPIRCGYSWYLSQL